MKLVPVSLGDIIDKHIETPDSLLGDEPILVPNGKLLVYGVPGIRKSFMVQLLLYCLSTGTPFLGFDVKSPINSLYYQVEVTEKQFQKRTQALTQAYPSEEARRRVYYLDDTDFVLDGPASTAALVQAAKACDAGAVVIDPLNLFMVGSENDDKAVRQFITALNAVRKETGAMVGFVHHSNKGLWHDGQQVLRKGVDISGSKNLWAWADTVIRLVEVVDQPNTIELIWEKCRNAEEPPNQWLWFNQAKYVLEMAPNDPQKMVLMALESGPVGIAEIDGMLKDECGFPKSGHKSRALRKTMVQRGLVREVRDPENKKRILLEKV